MQEAKECNSQWRGGFSLEMTTSWLLNTSTSSSCVLPPHDLHKIKAVNSPSCMEKGNMRTDAQEKDGKTMLRDDVSSTNRME